ncbi:DNA recombination protein RmuC [Synechococcus sp. A15-44]|uniref:DNA recombination protein RmuC n=1 Tax=Synechococcus sp. A15-44 TaxID=1050646 RepID=UPI002106998F|nr:DNA recombination protein RmuC [Synechococcus sp. A15-44]
MGMMDGATCNYLSRSNLSSVLVSLDSRRISIMIQQAEIAKNIDEIQAQAVGLHKRFSIFIDKFNDIGSQLTRLNKSFNAAVGSVQSRLLPQGEVDGRAGGAER